MCHGGLHTNMRTYILNIEDFRVGEDWRANFSLLAVLRMAYAVQNSLEFGQSTQKCLFTQIV